MHADSFCARATLAALSLLAATNFAGCALAPPIVIDGDPREWPGDTHAYADDHTLSLRFAPGERVTLQGGQRCTRLLLDLDCDASTGLALDGVGADLEVQISPLPDEPGAPLSRGVRVIAHAPDAPPRFLSHADIDLAFAPTYASDRYEARLNLDQIRAALSEAGVAPPRRDEPMRLRVLQSDAAGATLWSSGPIAVEHHINDEVYRSESDRLPSPPDRPAIRVVSHNVLRTSPERKTEQFARLYRAIDPDVVLVQEWDGYTAAQLVAWFRVQVPIEGEWRAVAHKSERGGVAVVSRFPVIEAIDQLVRAPGDEWPVRFVGAVIDTPGAPTLFGSVHLKCCGYADSDEDVRRIAEAKAINAAVRAAMDAHAVDRCILAGDLNLVGSRPPLDLLRSELDADGSDLETADTHVLGDRLVTYTWTDDRSEFSPGRLDWMVYSDATLRESSAWTLDTGELSDAALGAMGLERDDSRASDHLPLVVDLTPVE